MDRVLLKKEIVQAWDLLAERFNTHQHADKIHPDAAVNIVVGWPILFNEIKNHAEYLGKKKCAIFDFGCGSGSFCAELEKKGHLVVGMDRSKTAIANAQKNLPKSVALINGDHLSDVFGLEDFVGKFDIVTSIHSLEWIEDVDKALANLSKLLAPGGIILFAVFPKRHVTDSLIIKDLFEDFDSVENPYAGFANFSGIKVPVYIRDAKFFDDFFTKSKFEKVMEYYPQYPKDFFKTYNWTGSKYPEMTILAYRKY